jgi:hypothetical protein
MHRFFPFAVDRGAFSQLNLMNPLQLFAPRRQLFAISVTREIRFSPKLDGKIAAG